MTAPHRRGGLGRALLARAFELARERGCYRVILESGYAGDIAQRLYRSAGMRDEGKFFGIKFADT